MMAKSMRELLRLLREDIRTPAITRNIETLLAALKDALDLDGFAIQNSTMIPAINTANSGNLRNGTTVNSTSDNLAVNNADRCKESKIHKQQQLLGSKASFHAIAGIHGLDAALLREAVDREIHLSAVEAAVAQRLWLPNQNLVKNLLIARENCRSRALSLFETEDPNSKYQALLAADISKASIALLKDRLLREEKLLGMLLMTVAANYSFSHNETMQIVKIAKLCNNVPDLKHLLAAILISLHTSTSNNSRYQPTDQELLQMRQLITGENWSNNAIQGTN